MSPMEERVGASPLPSRSRRAPRLLIPTERAGLRVTWHRTEDEFTLTLWHGDECIGSAPLRPDEAGELSAFITAHLGERARWAPRVVVDDAPAVPDSDAASVADPKAEADRREGPRWLAMMRDLLRRP